MEPAAFRDKKCLTLNTVALPPAGEGLYAVFLHRPEQQLLLAKMCVTMSAGAWERFNRKNAEISLFLRA